jgi:hypothetical protein
MFLGRSRQVKKSYDKNSGEIPAEYIILTNQLLAEHTWGDPSRQKT